MANLFAVNVYQLNQTTYLRDQSVRFGFPTTGVTIQDVSASPTRSLSSNYNVYGLIVVNATGNEYYVQETFAALATLIG